MICVSIARGRHRYILAEHRHLVEHGARLVEIRVDYIRRAVNLKRLLQDRPSPVIVTCRRERDRGRWKGTENERLILLRTAIVDGADYIDLEEDIADLIPRYGNTKRIISYHNFEETPEDLDAIYRRLASKDPDIIKIATMANHTSDNVRMLELVRRADVPTVGFCMGEIGVPSRILTGKYGAPFTYATFHPERTLAPGQLSFRQMKEIYDYDSIGPETEIYGVVGDPVGHSLSPVIHNAAFRAEGMDKVYVPFRVPRQQLGTFLQDCRKLGVKGLSITIPHKEAVRAYLTHIERAAEQIGAVNTVVFADDGTITGSNTDMKAVLASLLSVPGLKDTDDPLKEKEVLVLGAGGVARAIVYGLVRRGANVTIASRTYTRAEDLARDFDCRAIPWDERHYTKPEILINATPVGMHPDVDATPFGRDYLRRTMIVFDTVYNPENTLLIKDAREKGCRCVTGVEMFVRQAAMQFKAFTGQDAPRSIMRDEVRRATSPARYRSLA